jgi:hypothetical protein
VLGDITESIKTVLKPWFFLILRCAACHSRAYSRYLRIRKVETKFPNFRGTAGGRPDLGDSLEPPSTSGRAARKARRARKKKILTWTKLALPGYHAIKSRFRLVDPLAARVQFYRKLFDHVAVESGNYSFHVKDIVSK